MSRPVSPEREIMELDKDYTEDDFVPLVKKPSRFGTLCERLSYIFKRRVQYHDNL